MPERDLDRMLATLSVRRRPGTFTFVSVEPTSEPAEAIVAAAQATIVEDEGTTFVVDDTVAVAAGFEVEFRAAWLTIEVFSALDAVGLTAAMSAALTDAGISCNVLAGAHHDHLLVPVDHADDAEAALLRLTEQA